MSWEPGKTQDPEPGAKINKISPPRAPGATRSQNPRPIILFAVSGGARSHQEQQDLIIRVAKQRFWGTPKKRIRRHPEQQDSPRTKTNLSTPNKFKQPQSDPWKFNNIQTNSIKSKPNQSTPINSNKINQI